MLSAGAGRAACRGVSSGALPHQRRSQRLAQRVGAVLQVRARLAAQAFALRSLLDAREQLLRLHAHQASARRPGSVRRAAAAGPPARLTCSRCSSRRIDGMSPLPARSSLQTSPFRRCISSDRRKRRAVGVDLAFAVEQALCDTVVHQRAEQRALQLEHRRRPANSRWPPGRRQQTCASRRSAKSGAMRRCSAGDSTKLSAASTPLASRSSAWRCAAALTGSSGSRPLPGIVAQRAHAADLARQDARCTRRRRAAQS